MVNTTKFKRIKHYTSDGKTIYTNGHVSLELKVENIESICRLCLFGNGINDIGQLPPEEKHLYDTYIADSSSQNGPYELPRNICDKCLHLIKIFVEFKISATEVEDILTNFIKQHNEEAVGMKEEITEISVMENVEVEYDELNIARNISVCKSEESEDMDVILLPQEDVHYQCEACGMFAETEQILNAHTCVNTDFILPDVQVAEKPILMKKMKSILITNTKEKYQCKSCGIFCQSKEDLNRHDCISIDMDASEAEENLHPFVVMQSNKSLYRCELCGSCFQTRRGLNKHNTMHTGLTLFKTDENPPADFKIVEAERKYICKTCGNCYETKRGLSRHLFIHTGISQENANEATNEYSENKMEHSYQCKLCDRCYQSKRSLDRHSLVHTGMPLWCNICEKGFSGPKLLKDHMNTHSGQYPYSCSMCTKIFSTSDALRSHKVYHHSGNRRILKSKRLEMELSL